MKRIIGNAVLAAVCLAVLFSGPVSRAGSGTVESEGAGEKIPVTAQYEPGQPGGQSVYRTDVSWGNMKFTYRKTEEVRWDASAHEYLISTEGTWISGGSRITFANHSNRSVTASLRVQMEPDASGIRGTFDQAQITLDSAEGTAPEEAPSGEASLSLSGSLEESQTAFVKVGTVTLQIRQEAEGVPGGILQHEETCEIFGRCETAAGNIGKSELTGEHPVTLEDGTVIRAKSSSGGDAALSAVMHRVSEEAALDWLEARIGSPASRMYPLWIGFYEGMKEAVPSGEVIISMEVPEGFERARLCYVDPDGNVRTLSYTTAGEQVQFPAAQPGYYVWVNQEDTGTPGGGETGDTELSGSTDKPAESQNTAYHETQEPAKTGDTADPVTAAGFMLAAAVVAAAARKRIS